MEDRLTGTFQRKLCLLLKTKPVFFFHPREGGKFICRLKTNVGGDTQENTGSLLVDWHSSQHRNPISGALTLSIHCWHFTHLSSPLPFSLRLDAVWSVDFKEVWEKLFFVSVQILFSVELSHFSYSSILLHSMLTPGELFPVLTSWENTFTVNNLNNKPWWNKSRHGQEGAFAGSSTL